MSPSSPCFLLLKSTVADFMLGMADDRSLLFFLLSFHLLPVFFCSFSCPSSFLHMIWCQQGGSM